MQGGDLTDPENDGVDGAHTNWNWSSISASSEPRWTGEGSYNVFDNKVGSSQNKWCCNGPTQWIAVEFAQAYVLTSFTITSGNDVPSRDPDVWKIQGSNDGNNWTTFLLIIIMVLHLGVTVIKFFCIVEAEMIILHQVLINISGIV